MSDKLKRLRRLAMHGRTRALRQYYTTLYLRQKAREGIWDVRMLNGHPGDITRACQSFIMRAVAAGLVVTSTTDGQHAETSYHYKRPPGHPLGRAVDIGVRRFTPWALRRRIKFQQAEARHPRRFLELFGPDNVACVKNGRPIVLGEGTPLETLHDTHVHGAPRW